MLKDLVAGLGEYEVIDSLRTSADDSLRDANGNVVNANGQIIDDETTIQTGKLTTVVGCREHFADGLLSFVLSDEILGKFLKVDESDPDNILNKIIPALTADTAADGVITLLTKLTTKYLVEYTVLAALNGNLALEKMYTYYVDDTAPDGAEKRTIKKAQAEKAVENIDGILGPILDMVGVGTLEELIGGLVFTDDMVNMIAGLLAGLFSGLNSSTCST